MPGDDNKPKCPKCKVELTLVEGKPPVKCEKCGFLLSGFPDFLEWFKVALEETKPKKPTVEKPDSPFAALGKL